MHVLTKCNIKNDPITDRQGKYPIKKVKMTVSRIQPTNSQMMRGDVGKKEAFTVEQMKDAFCCEDRTKVGMRDSEFYVVHKGP